MSLQCGNFLLPLLHLLTHKASWLQHKIERTYASLHLTAMYIARVACSPSWNVVNFPDVKALRVAGLIYPSVPRSMLPVFVGLVVVSSSVSSCVTWPSSVAGAMFLQHCWPATKPCALHCVLCSSPRGPCLVQDAMPAVCISRKTSTCTPCRLMHMLLLEGGCTARGCCRHAHVYPAVTKSRTLLHDSFTNHATSWQATQRWCTGLGSWPSPTACCLWSLW